MKFRSCAAIAAFGLCAAGSVWAGDYKVGQIEVDDLWVRASAPGQTNGAGYLDIDTDAKTPDRLLSVTSSAAERVELHTVQTENGVARMRQVDGGIAVPADGEVKLRPGGYHVMFIKLKAPFAEGGTVPVTLEFEKAGSVELSLPVRAVPAAAGHGHGHDSGEDKGHSGHN